MEPIEQRFCKDLTSVSEVSARHAYSVVNRARVRFGVDQIDSMLDLFGRGGVEAVLADGRFAGKARSILYCLYTAVLPDEHGSDLAQQQPELQNPDDFFESVLWRVIQAHPPGLSGGYFGHWHYPPEDGR